MAFEERRNISLQSLSRQRKKRIVSFAPRLYIPKEKVPLRVRWHPEPKWKQRTKEIKYIFSTQNRIWILKPSVWCHYTNRAILDLLIYKYITSGETLSYHCHEHRRFQDIATDVGFLCSVRWKKGPVFAASEKNMALEWDTVQPNVNNGKNRVALFTVYDPRQRVTLNQIESFNTWRRKRAQWTYL